MRLIDADALYELIDNGFDIDFDEAPETKVALLEMIEGQETVEERKKGKWIQTEEHIGGVCFNCGEVCQAVELGTDFPVRSIWNFCPNCGCQMEG